MYPLVEIKQHDETHHVETQPHRFFYWEYDIKKNLFKLSSHFILLLGLNPKMRLRHDDLVELMHPDDQSKHQTLFEKLKEGRVESYEHTFRIHNQEGEYLHIQEQGEIFAYDKDGVAVKILGSYTLVQAKYSEKSKYAKELPIEYSEYWVWEIDTLGYLTYVNEDTTQILGYSAKELLGKNIFDLMPKIELQRVLPIYQKAFEKREPIKELLNAIIPQKGDTLYFLVNAKAFYDKDGEYIGYRGLSKDISKEVHLEQELNKLKIILSQREEELKLAHTRLIEKAKQEAFKSKAEFLSNMSQDLRSPMKNIITIASQTLEEELPKQKQDSCEKIHTSARTLLEIMNDILDLSQYSAGKLIIENEDFDLLETIDTIMHVIDIKAHAKKIRVDISYEREVKRYYKGDAKRLGQILSNVLSTTIHLSDGGRIDFHINCNSNKRLRFEITNYDLSLSKEEQALLFKPFEEIDSPLALGLTLAQHLTHMMQGTIACESNEEEGSSFVVEIPLEEGDEPQRLEMDGERLEELRYALNTLVGSRILLIASDNRCYSSLDKHIKHSGIMVDRFDTTQEALMYQNSLNSYALILAQSDEVASVVATSTTTPIIALSEASDEYALKESGNIADGLTKPIDAIKLYQILLQFIPPQRLVSDSKSTIEGDLPQFENIDTTIGLKYCNNNIEDYIEMLHSFRAEYYGIFLGILNENELQNTIMKLKDQSEKIGAYRVHETILSYQRKNDERILDKVYKELHNVIEEVESNLVETG